MEEIKSEQNSNLTSNKDETNKTMRNRKIIIAIVAIIVVVTIIILVCSLNNYSMSGIKIIQEQLVTDPRYAIIGNNLYPIVVIKVKNTSNTTKKVSFEANFYADNNFLGSDQASYITLAPGDEAYLQAQCNKGYSAWTAHEYSYKITKWHVY